MGNSNKNKSSRMEKSENAVLVNDNSIADALSATPFAKAKDAPILLTQSNKLIVEQKQN